MLLMWPKKLENKRFLAKEYEKDGDFLTAPAGIARFS